MRLINAISLDIVEFMGNTTPKYAILSHTWGDEEISLSEFQRGDPLTKTKLGYQKIENACKETSRRNLSYIWIDTCCIDKTSSAELSEAINSMFQWYEEAEICFAYLVDATSARALEPAEASRWFTRGWTLQELLAPPRLKFFDKDWAFIADRQDAASAISLTTGIDQVFFMDTNLRPRRRLLGTASGATKMSWAARRTTTRKEDIAYCLLGIFDVNMPLIYGEGMRAFIRLQQEIFRNSFDPTLLAWNHANLLPSPPETGSFTWSHMLDSLLGNVHPWKAGSHSRASVDESPTGLIASSPGMFLHCRNITAHKITCDWNFRSQGLLVTLPTSEDEMPYAMIPCHLEGDPTKLLALPLHKCTPGVYLRSSDRLGLFNHKTWQRWPKQRIMLRLTTTDDCGILGHNTQPSSLWIRRMSPSLTMLAAFHAFSLQSHDAPLELRPCHLEKSNPLVVFSGNQTATEGMIALLLEDNSSDMAFAILIKAVENPAYSILVPPGINYRRRIVCRYLRSSSREHLSQDLRLLTWSQFDSLPAIIRLKKFVCVSHMKVRTLGQKTWALDIDLSDGDPRRGIIRFGQWSREQVLKSSHAYLSARQILWAMGMIRILKELAPFFEQFVSQLLFFIWATSFTLAVWFLLQQMWAAMESLWNEAVCGSCCPSLCLTSSTWSFYTVLSKLLSVQLLFPFAYRLLLIASYCIPEASNFISARRSTFACTVSMFAVFLNERIFHGDILQLYWISFLPHVPVLFRSFKSWMRRTLFSEGRSWNRLLWVVWEVSSPVLSWWLVYYFFPIFSEKLMLSRDM